MIDLDELSEEGISAVVNTRLFQKPLAYRRHSRDDAMNCPGESDVFVYRREGPADG